MTDEYEYIEPTNVRARTPWMSFLLLLCLFYFVQPFDVTYSVQYLDQKRITDIDIGIDSVERGSAGRRIGLLLLAVVAVVSMADRWHFRFRVNGLLGVTIVVFLLWAASSILWSHAPALTIRRVIRLLCVCIGALGFAERFSWRDLIVCVFFVGVVSLVGGLLCEIFFGTFRPWDSGHRFGGFINPIHQGISLSMLILAALILARSSARNRRFYLAWAVAAIPFLLMTRSRVPTAGAIAAVVVLWAFFYSGRAKATALTLFCFLFCLLLLVLGDDLFSYVLRTGSLGRESLDFSTLTGRTPMWQECFEMALERPILGYGYDSFWIPKYITAITDATGFSSLNTHNVYLDWLLGVGIPGAILGTLILVLSLIKTVILYRVSHNIVFVFACGMLVIFSINLMMSAVQLYFLTNFMVLIIIAKLGFEHSTITSFRNQRGQESVPTETALFNSKG